jgi:hypothetical protein
VSTIFNKTLESAKLIGAVGVGNASLATAKRNEAD